MIEGGGAQVFVNILPQSFIMHSIACRKALPAKSASIIDRDKSREIDTRNEQKRPRKRCNRMQFLASCLEAILAPETSTAFGLTMRAYVYTFNEWSDGE